MVQLELFASRAMCERDMVVGDVVEKVDLFLLEEKTRGDRMHRGISPSFVKEPTVFVKSIEVVGVGLRSEPVEIANLEIRPLEGQRQLSPGTMIL